MKKTKWIVMAMVFVLAGCATIKKDFPLDVDQTAQAFFDDLQRSDNSAAYGLLGKGLSQRISFDQFDQFMQTIRQQWGRIETDETAVYPFHRRLGEDEFIPLKVTTDKIKRYTFDVKFDDAEMNFDLTLAPEGESYKIVWFSVWGSSVYVNKKVQDKIKDLFSGNDNAGNADNSGIPQQDPPVGGGRNGAIYGGDGSSLNMVFR